MKRTVGYKAAPDPKKAASLARLIYEAAVLLHQRNRILLARSEPKGEPVVDMTSDPDWNNLRIRGDLLLAALGFSDSRMETFDADITSSRSKVTLICKTRDGKKEYKVTLTESREDRSFRLQNDRFEDATAKFTKKEPLAEKPIGDNARLGLKFISDSNSIKGVTMQKGGDTYSYFSGSGFFVNGKPAVDRGEVADMVNAVTNVRMYEVIFIDGNNEFARFARSMRKDAERLSLQPQKPVKAKPLEMGGIEVDQDVFSWKRPEKSWVN